MLHLFREGGRNIPQVGRPPSSFARPTSARPAPPRPKTAMVEEEVVYRPPTTKIPVILDSEEMEEEETGDNRKQELLSLLTATPTSVNLTFFRKLGSGLHTSIIS